MTAIVPAGRGEMETSLIRTSMSAHNPPPDTCLMEREKKNQTPDSGDWGPASVSRLEKCHLEGLCSVGVVLLEVWGCRRKEWQHGRVGLQGRRSWTGEAAGGRAMEKGLGVGERCGADRRSKSGECLTHSRTESSISFCVSVSNPLTSSFPVNLRKME